MNTKKNNKTAGVTPLSTLYRQFKGAKPAIILYARLLKHSAMPLACVVWCSVRLVVKLCYTLDNKVRIEHKTFDDDRKIRGH